jgi:iron complex outermembrane receptor protein
VRVSRYHIFSTASLIFDPPRRSLTLANVFVQDSVALTDTTKLILGLKLEDDPYVGVTALPSARFTWKAGANALLWAAVSRAIRSPTPFDRDVIEKDGATVFLKAHDFQTEKLTAWELGARVQASATLSFSASGFYNVYSDLRNIEPTPITFTPLFWGNGMRGSTYGAEAWADWRPVDWWRLSAGLNLLEEDLEFRPGASTLLGVAQAGDDPEVQAQLKSFMNLGRRVTLDASLRYVDDLPDPRVPSYVELDGRIGFNLSDRVQLGVSGANLLHKRHQEFPAPAANAVPRSVLAEMRLAF